MVASLPFPDLGSVLVLLPSGRPAAGARGYLYADEELTVVAEAYRSVNSTKGALLPTDEQGRRYITIDAFGRQPRYFGPASGAQSLWIVINGIASRVDADYDPRIDALETAMAGLRERLDLLDGSTSTPGGSAFDYNPGTGALYVQDTAAGIAYSGGFLTVDDVLAAGVTYSGGVLTVSAV